jgi:hypothetical protein
VKQLFLICLVVMLAGLVIVILPDGDDRVMSFSERHGPSFVDVVGLFLIIGPWLVMAIHAISNWPAVIQAYGRKLVSVLLAAALGGLMVLVVAIRSDSYVLWVGASISALAQFGLIVPAFRKKRKRR